MTNKEAKQEAIKKAYGPIYQKLKSRIDSNGYVEFTNQSIPLTYLTHPEHLGLDPSNEVDWNGTRWRPISLRGFHDNNGWIRIEPDGTNLPTDDSLKKYKAYSFNEKCFYDSPLRCEAIIKSFEKGVTTHYKPITPEPKPIY